MTMESAGEIFSKACHLKVWWVCVVNDQQLGTHFALQCIKWYKFSNIKQHRSQQGYASFMFKYFGSLHLALVFHVDSTSRKCKDL